MEYRVIYSRRRTLQLEITRTAEVVVRAPNGTSAQRIAQFLQQSEAWLHTHLARRIAWNEAHPEPTAEQEQALTAAAKAYLPRRTLEYAAIMGVQPTNIRITSARTRFGSCSAKNAICYSWRLMQYPQAAVDSVIVHELAHIIHKNHSREFYRTIDRFMPDYRERQALLRG